MHTTTIAQYIDSYADAVANLRVAQHDQNATPETLKYLRTRMELDGWRLRHLGILVEFEGCEE